MASNTQSTKGTETTTKNADSAQEIRVVDTVDHRSSAGQGQEERSTENIQVIHQPHPAGEPGTGTGTGTGQGILAGAAEAMANTVRSAKEAIATNYPK